MQDPQFIKTLRRKIEDIEAQIEQYRRLISEKQNDLVHLKGTIALFERDNNPNGGGAQMSVANIYKRGELVQACLSMLGNGATLTTSELAARCLLDRGHDPSDNDLHRAMTQQLIQVLNIQANTGKKIVSPGKRGVAKLWSIARPQAA